MDAQQKPDRTQRRMRWVIGLSLALNLVFIGVFAGAALRFQRDGGAARASAPPIQSYGAPLARSLPREARRELIMGMRKMPGMPNRRERRALYQEMLTALRANPFDAAQVEAIFARQGDVAQKVQTFATGRWLSLVSEMTPAERLVVADRLEEALRRPQRGPKPRE